MVVYKITEQIPAQMMERQVRFLARQYNIRNYVVVQIGSYFYCTIKQR